MFGYGSDDINGQMVGVKTSDAYHPRVFGPIVNVTSSSVSAVPPSLGAGGGVVGGGYNGSGDVADTGGAANLASATTAATHPWDLALSPVPMALIFLVVGLVGLRVVHWRS